MTYRLLYKLLCALLLATSAMYAVADAPTAKPLPSIVLVGTQDTHDSPIGKWLTLVYTTAFERLGYQLEYKPYPSKRASIASDSGEADGEIFRFLEYGDDHPNLIRINESPFAVNWSAYSIHVDKPLSGWASLINTNYRVGYRSGSRKIEYELPKVLPPAQLLPANSTTSGLEMLYANRTDIYIDIEELAQSRINQNKNLKNINRIGLMENCPMYAFLNKKHQALIVPLENVLKDMKKEGLIEKYRVIAHTELAPTKKIMMVYAYPF